MRIRNGTCKRVYLLMFEQNFRNINCQLYTLTLPFMLSYISTDKQLSFEKQKAFHILQNKKNSMRFRIGIDDERKHHLSLVICETDINGYDLIQININRKQFPADILHHHGTAFFLFDTTQTESQKHDLQCATSM